MLWRTKFLWLVALLCWRSAAAIPQYVTQSWQTKDGLPQSSVTTVLQTQDGYIWVGTYNGLGRFDGVQFTVFDNHNAPEMHSQGITSLFEATDGTLWIGHANGEVTLYKAGQFAEVKLNVQWGTGPIRGIAQDDVGDIWLCNEQGLLARVRDEKLLTPQPGVGDWMVSMVSSKSGMIWVLRNGLVSELRRGELKVLITDANNPNSFVQGITASHDGQLWVMHDGLLRKWTGQTWTKDLGRMPLSSEPRLQSAPQMLEGKAGWLAAAVTGQGFYMWQPGKDNEALQFSRTNGFPSDWVTALLEDREGNLWIGTGGAGLHRMRPAKVQTVAPPDQWQGRTVVSVSEGRDGAIWVGAEGAGLYRYKKGQWENFASRSGLANPYVWSAVEDVAGRLWVATWGGGLFSQHGEQFITAAGLESIVTPMRAIWCSRDGGLWLGTSDGLLRYEDGRSEWYGREISPAERTVCCVIEDRAGVVWFGMSGGGLGRFQNGVLTRFRKSDGLASDFVACLRESEDGALWIGTSGGGLTRLKAGRFAVISREQGLPSHYICHIETDARGFFWMSSHNGIIRARKADLDRCADGLTNEIQCLSYGLSDGMPTLECTGGLQPAGCKTSDGRLWFSTSKGLVTIDPQFELMNPLPPPVVIENLLVDESLVAGLHAKSVPLRIPAGNHRFEFQYTGLSFSAPEKVCFKYRLLGLNPEWVRAGPHRSANYSYLPPGKYTFQVTACNNDGIWNVTGAAFAFQVLPHFWQTIWFRLLVGFGTGSLIASIVWLEMRRRGRRKLERIERQRAVERERTRIAKDIHDDLGANLTRITLLSQSAQGELDNPKAAAAELDRIYETARDLTRAMDEIVWAVNPQHDTLNSLASYLSKFAQDYVRAAKLRCWFNVPTHLPAWPLTAEVRHNLFLAVKEALHNIVKHSAASEVRITLTVQAKHFILSISDNGCGFTPGALRPIPTHQPDRTQSGNGLANMRRRLAEIGGNCEIRSSPRTGTNVCLEVSLDILSNP